MGSSYTRQNGKPDVYLIEVVHTSLALHRPFVITCQTFGTEDQPRPWTGAHLRRGGSRLIQKQRKRGIWESVAHCQTKGCTETERKR